MSWRFLACLCYCAFPLSLLSLSFLSLLSSLSTFLSVVGGNEYEDLVKDKENEDLGKSGIVMCSFLGEKKNPNPNPKLNL